MDNPFNLPNNSQPKSKTNNLPVQKSEEFKGLVPKGTELTPEQSKALHEFTRSVKYGISTYVAAIKCKGMECPMISKCPLNKGGIDLPIGDDCPVENYFIEEKIRGLTKDLDIKEEEMGSVYDKLLINDLAYYELLDFRASIEMSEDPKIVKREMYGVSQDGEPLMSTVVNPIIIFKEKVAKAKMKILEELIATRKARAADNRANTRDKSSQMAEMLKRVKTMKENSNIIVDVDAKSRIVEEPEIDV